MNQNNLPHHLWDQCLRILENELSKPSFETWIKSVYLHDYQNDNLTLAVQNTFAKDWVQNHYSETIKHVCESVFNNKLNVSYFIPIENELEEETDDLFTNDNNHKSKNNGGQFKEDFALTTSNAKYTFDTFVIGDSNRFAHAASLAVAEAPAKSYNPLFIYGGVGLGKTHLMHAIGHFVKEQNKDAKVMYVSSETFTNELINSIRDDNTVEFRNKYRSIDVLLIDDIQFLAKKERTQEEFFHTFNSLHESNKQLVISSDRPPKEIPTLEDRLRSRFEWGLITDIQAPDLETRIAILRKKAAIENLTVPNDVMQYIADQIKSNIRELEGALIRVVASSSLTGKDINAEMAAEVLKDILPDNKPKQITISSIQQIVAKHYNLRIEEMKAKKRTRNVSYPRQIAMYLCRELTDTSLPKIGDEFGGRDHTTVIHAHEKIGTALKSDVNLQQNITELVKEINKK